MLPYFYKLRHKILLTQEKDKAAAIALTRLEKFWMHGNSKYGDSGNNILYGKFVQDIEFISFISKNTCVSHYPIVIMHTPNSHITRHRDIPNNRDTVLTIPIYPNQNYAPTLYFKDSIQIEPEAICDHSDEMPSFMNTTELHEVRNSDSYRLNIQLCFTKKIEEIVELYESGKLFKDELYSR